LPGGHCWPPTRLQDLCRRVLFHEANGYAPASRPWSSRSAVARQTCPSAGNWSTTAPAVPTARARQARAWRVHDVVRPSAKPHRRGLDWLYWLFEPRPFPRSARDRPSGGSRPGSGRRPGRGTGQLPVEPTASRDRLGLSCAVESCDGRTFAVNSRGGWEVLVNRFLPYNAGKIVRRGAGRFVRGKDPQRVRRNGGSR